MLMPKPKLRANYAMVAEDDPLWRRFWDAYPKRVSKKEARKAWAQINPSPETVDQMVETLNWQCRMPAWLKDGGQYIPYPASWLRDARWEDEPVGVPMLSDKTARNIVAADEFVRGKDHGPH